MVKITYVAAWSCAGLLVAAVPGSVCSRGIYRELLILSDDPAALKFCSQHTYLGPTVTVTQSTGAKMKRQDSTADTGISTTDTSATITTPMTSASTTKSKPTGSPRKPPPRPVRSTTTRSTMSKSVSSRSTMSRSTAPRGRPSSQSMTKPPLASTSSMSSRNMTTSVACKHCTKYRHFRDAAREVIKTACYCIQPTYTVTITPSSNATSSGVSGSSTFSPSASVTSAVATTDNGSGSSTSSTTTILSTTTTSIPSSTDSDSNDDATTDGSFSTSTFTTTTADSGATATTTAAATSTTDDDTTTTSD